jgi:uncharacterized protein with von Willebrand factor type A (vWA) domain
MSEELDGPQAGAEGVVAPEAVDENAEATTAQPTATESAELADDAGEATEEPSKRFRGSRSASMKSRRRNMRRNGRQTIGGDWPKAALRRRKPRPLAMDRHS